MRRAFILFLLLGVTAGCTSQPTPLKIDVNDNKSLIETVVDYSGSYRNLVTLDSEIVASLYLITAKSGGTIVHIGIQANSSNEAVFLAHIDKIDTQTSTVKNVYLAARIKEHNKNVIASHISKLRQQIGEYLQETSKFATAPYSDLQHSLQLAQATACETIYQGKRRFVLVMSDMRNWPPGSKREVPLRPLDFCDATILLVRPSPVLSTDSLRSIFINADLHTFTTVSDALTFINEYKK